MESYMNTPGLDETSPVLGDPLDVFRAEEYSTQAATILAEVGSAIGSLSERVESSGQLIGEDVERVRKLFAQTQAEIDQLRLQSPAQASEMQSITDRAARLARWIDTFRSRTEDKGGAIASQSTKLAEARKDRADKDSQAARSAAELGNLMRGDAVPPGKSDAEIRQSIGRLSGKYHELTSAVGVLAEQIAEIQTQLRYDTNVAREEVAKELESIRREKDAIMAEIARADQAAESQSKQGLHRVLGKLVMQLQELGYLPDEASIEAAGSSRYNPEDKGRSADVIPITPPSARLLDGGRVLKFASDGKRR